MKKKYQQPASVAITLQSQLPLAESTYTVNGFKKGEEETLGGDASSVKGANPNTVDWDDWK